MPGFNLALLIVDSIESAKLKPGKDISICLDVAANELIDKEGNYLIQSGSHETVDNVVILPKFSLKRIFN